MIKVAKFIVAGAMALVVAGAMPALAADAPAPVVGHVSPAAGKDLQAAQKAMDAEKYDDVQAALEKVKANPKKNEYDEYAMNQMYYNLYVAQKKLPEAEPVLEALLASRFMAPDSLKKFIVAAAYVNYEIQNYDKTIQFGNQAVTGGYAPEQLQTVVAQAYYLKNDFKTTDSFVRGLVESQMKAGQVPTDDLLQLGLSATIKLNDTAGQVYYFEVLVTYHPKPEYWQSLLDGIYRSKLTDKQALQVYRLSAEVGAMQAGSEYAEMAELALAAGSPGEAVSVLNKGFAAKAFTTAPDQSRSQKLLDTAKKQAAADQPTLEKTEADAANDAKGDRLVGAGVGYFGYGDYAKAAKDISAGLAKGMAKDSTDARLLLGIAQLKTGDKAAAMESFKQVKGDPVSERLAQLWTLRAKT